MGRIFQGNGGIDQGPTVARDQLYKIKSQNILNDCSKRLKKFHSFRTAEDKFLTSGYIVQAYCDSGDYDQMLQAVKIKN